MAFLRRLYGAQRLIAAYLTVGLALGVGYFALPDPGSAACYIGLSILPLLAIAAGVLRHAPSDKRPWLLLAAAQAAFLLGDVLWYAAYLPEGIDPTSPHVSDAFYLAGYPLLALGVWLFIRARQPRYRLTAGLDALVLGVAAMLVLWTVGVDAIFHDATMSLSERAVLTAYPMCDVAILAAAAYLLLSGRRSGGAFYLLVGSLAALSLADLAYVVVPDETIAGYATDALWMASYLLFGLTALVRSMVNLTQPSESLEAPEGTGRLLLLGVAIGILPAFAIHQRFFLDHQDLWLTGASGVIMLVAIILRMRELTAVHRRTESRYASLLANASDAFAIVTQDGRLTYSSPASARVLGYASDQLLGRSVLEFIHPRAAQEASAGLRRVSAKPGAQLETELRIQRHDGKWRWLSIVATNRSDDPIVDGIVLNFRDVTDRKENESRIDLQARVLDEVQHAVLVADESGRITYWNRAAEQLFGWPADAAIGRRPVDVGLPLTEEPGATADASPDDRMSGEFEIKRRDGRRLTAILTTSRLLDHDGQQRGVIVIAFDISDRKLLEERLHQQAFTDALTGLANRALFLDRVGHVLARRRRKTTHGRLAVLFLDVDDFKTVNDSMGHVAGDELLVVLARRLASIVRPTDTAARLGGDEFALLLEDTGQAEAESVARRLLADLARPVLIGGREVHISVSIGIAAPDAGVTVSAAELLRDADLAMYRAKTRLQGSYAVYQPQMHEAALRRLELKADLQRVIETDGLDLEYQPISRLSDGTPVGAEALLRWRHPERGLVPVAETLALAEAAGLIVPLGAWVLDTACRRASEWRSKVGRAAGIEPPFVAVNASARELLDPTYPDLVATALTSSGLPAQALAIEITESDLMQESEAAISALRNLKQLGVRLSIDDFGTGYSSLAYLARFPLDVLKIDRTFVSSQASGQDGAIAKAIIDLAGSLGLEVIAEGVEREVDRELMVRLGATYGQGFHLGRPTTSDGMLAVLRGRGVRQPRARRVRKVARALAPSEP